MTPPLWPSAPVQDAIAHLDEVMGLLDDESVNDEGEDLPPSHARMMDLFRAAESLALLLEDEGWGPYPPREPPAVPPSTEGRG